jgi:hypothetical protein
VETTHSAGRRRRPRIFARHGLNEGQIDALCEELVANAIWREPSVTELAAERGDDHLWNLLHMHAGAVLVTSDRPLQANAPAFAQVMSPEHFLSTITGTAEGL